MTHITDISIDDDQIVRPIEKGLRSILLKKQLHSILSDLKHLASLNGNWSHIARFLLVSGILFLGYLSVPHHSLADFEFMTVAVAGITYVFALAISMLWLMVGWFLDIGGAVE